MLSLRSIPNVTLLVLLALLGACAERPTVDYNGARNFYSLHNYAWASSADQQSKDPVLYNALDEQRVHDAVNYELTSRGYKQSDEKSADFLVTYHVTLKQRVQGNSVGMGMGMWGPPFMLGGEVAITQYEEEELFIDLLDAKTHELIWRGSLRRPVGDRQTPEKRAAEIHKKVSVILGKFPPP